MDFIVHGVAKNQTRLSDFHFHFPRVMKLKAETNKWDLIKPKSFCTAKETISMVKRQHSEWEIIIANEGTDKEFISKLYKQLL